MTLIIVLAILLPWSLYRQMHVHSITRDSLIKLPLIFGAVGVIALIGTHIDTSHAAIAALAISVIASIVLGAWRGAQMPIWRDQDGSWLIQGNRLTMTLWGVLIAFKFLLGAVGSQTGWYPVEPTGEIFLTLGLSFVIQNIIVARRSIAQDHVAGASRSIA
jgi:hypothetical protein